MPKQVNHGLYIDLISYPPYLVWALVGQFMIANAFRDAESVYWECADAYHCDTWQLTIRHTINVDRENYTDVEENAITTNPPTTCAYKDVVQHA